MKKVLSVFAISVLMLGMVTSGALASEIDILREVTPSVGTAWFPTADANLDGSHTTQGPVTFDALWAANAPTGGIEVDLGNSAGWPHCAEADVSDRFIGYYSSVALTSTSTLTFTLTNGGIDQDSTMFLLAYNVPDVGTPGWVVVGVLNDFVTDVNGNMTSVRFQIDTNNAPIEDAKLLDKDGTATGAMAVSDPVAANVVMIMSHDATPVAPRIVVNKGLSSAEAVKIQLPVAKDNNANDLDAPKAGSEVLIDVIDGVLASITHTTPLKAGEEGPATSTINVEADPPRALFVPEKNGDTTPTTSEAFFNITNQAEYGLKLNAGDTWNLTIERGDVAGVEGITMAGTAATLNTENTNQWYRKDVAFDDNCTTIGDITITVDGETILQTGSWKVVLSINPDKDATEPVDLPVLTLLNNETSHIWDLNGAQFIIPMINNTTENGGVTIELSNASAIDADVTADVISSVNGVTKTGVPIGKVFAKSSKTFSAKNFNKLITAAVPELATSVAINQKYAVRIIVNAPAAQVTCEGIQNDKNGVNRVVPVLTGDDSEGWNF